MSQDKKLTRIIAAVVDTKQLTMYKEDGTTVCIPQGDSRLRPIVDAITPQLVRQSYADVDLTVPTESSYQEFQKESGGLVQFFRIAKSKLKGFFAAKVDDKEPEPVGDLKLGKIPVPELTEEVKVDQESEVDTAMAAVNDIIQHAIPVTDPSFTEADLDKQEVIADQDGYTPNAHNPMRSDDTIIAVVDGKHVVPGVELIKSQFTRAAKLGSTIGVENFLRRIGAVIHDRKHSVEDLLKFMERGDLPIADDGSILIYKILRTSAFHQKKDVFVDCHTGNVEQWVGAYVCMDKELVDPDRRNECSNGLHVARRGYIGNFSGNVCVLAKLAPEDVIAVPSYDANKMRVCGYHIIMQLSQEQYDNLKRNKPITDTEEGKQLLARALAGDHIGMTHEVKITQHKGGGVFMTKMGTPDPIPETKTEESEVLDKAEALSDPEAEALDEALDPKQVSKTVLEEIQEAKKETVSKAPKKLSKRQQKKAKAKALAKPKNAPTASVVTAKPGTPRHQIEELLAEGELTKARAKQITDIKRAAKKGWEALGVDQADVEKIIKLNTTA